MIRHSVVTARTVILALPAILLLVLGVAPPATPNPYLDQLSQRRGHRHPAHRLRLRPVRCAERSGDERLGRFAVPRSCHLTSRTEPDLRCAAEPHSDVGRAGLEELAPDPDLPGPSGAVRRPPPRGTSRASNAAAKGTADAIAAVAAARALGLLPGNAIYGDMENYNAADTGCRDAVRRYVSSWTKELHRVGYLSGMYSQPRLGRPAPGRLPVQLHRVRPVGRPVDRPLRPCREPDRMDGDPGLALVQPSAGQAVLGRTDGDVRRGDDDRRQQRWDAPVGTVAYSYTATSAAPLNARSGPGTSYPVTATYPTGTTLKVVCQTPGSTVSTTSVWNKLAPAARMSPTTT